MATQVMIPGGPMIQLEEDGTERMVPGGPMVNEITAAAPAPSTVPNTLMLMGTGT